MIKAPGATVDRQCGSSQQAVRFARLLTTLVHALARTGGRYGQVTMCEGGGQANVTIVERL